MIASAPFDPIERAGLFAKRMRAWKLSMARCGAWLKTFKGENAWNV